MLCFSLYIPLLESKKNWLFVFQTTVYSCFVLLYGEESWLIEDHDHDSKTSLFIPGVFAKSSNIIAKLTRGLRA